MPKVTLEERSRKTRAWKIEENKKIVKMKQEKNLSSLMMGGVSFPMMVNEVSIGLKQRKESKVKEFLSCNRASN